MLFFYLFSKIINISFLFIVEIKNICNEFIKMYVFYGKKINNFIKITKLIEFFGTMAK
jgi:hypothetical protein